jgi:ethanolamine utilization protein EutQ (cupin superfamily)
MEQHRIDFESMDWVEPGGGVRVKVSEQGGKRVRLLELGKEFIEEDWCEKGHVGYVLEGKMEIDFDREVIEFGAGDVLIIPAGSEHKHKARVLTETIKVFLVE